MNNYTIIIKRVNENVALIERERVRKREREKEGDKVREKERDVEYVQNCYFYF